jgi:hypothetical protein
VSFWRKAEPTLTDGQVVKGGMWPHQHAWWHLPNFVKLLVTGYGGGKTNILCKRMIAQALHNAPVPVAIVSPTFSLARETVIATLEELCEGKASLAPTFAWKHNKSDHTFTLKHGSGRHAKIIVYSGEKPDRLRGPNLGPVGIDEPFIQDYEVFRQMVARIRHPRAKTLELVCTGTPEALNWGYELAEGDLRDHHDVGIVQASTMDNRALAASYGERLEAQYASKEVAAYVHGQFVNLSTGQVYYGFDPAVNVKELVRPRNGDLGAGMDFGAARNYASMASVSFWTDGHRMHVFDEEEQIHSDTPSMAHYLSDIHGGKLTEIYPDASGQARQSTSGDTDFHVLNAQGFNVNCWGQNPERRERYNRVNAMLETGRLTIEPECRKLRAYLSGHTHEDMSKQKQMTHLLDALGYPVCYLFPSGDHALHTVTIQ